MQTTQTMQAIYEIKNGFLGESAEIAAGQPAPAGWTFTQPPKVTKTKAARWDGDGWTLVLLAEQLAAADTANLLAEQQRLQEAQVTMVSMRQARLALLGAGLLDQVETAIAAMEGTAGKAAQIEWEYATEVKRDSPLVSGLGQALQLDEETLDLLFAEGATL